MNTKIGSRWSPVWLFCRLGFFLVCNAACQAQTWINPNSGKWEDTNSWSPAILPQSGAGVVITNAGVKTVLIDQSTANNYPASMTIGQLLLANNNTLLISNVPANTPFHVSNGQSYYPTYIFTNATVAIVNSSVVNDVYLQVQGGKIKQNGGSLQTSSFFMRTGEVDLTNGTFDSIDGDFQVAGGAFNQYSGSVAVLGGPDLSVYNGGSYLLQDGSLVTGDELGVGASANFVQNGGTGWYEVYGLALGGDNDFATGNYVLNNGTIFASRLEVDGYGRYYQNGGSTVFTNGATVVGAFIDRPRGDYVPGDGTLVVSNGTFAVPSQFMLYGSNATFIETGGSVAIGSLSLQSLDGQSKIQLSGGTLICTNVSYVHDTYFGSGADILQSGGEFRIENVFSFGGGRRDHNYALTGYANYDFRGGTLYASNIELNAEWIIGSSASGGRITNPGYFKMAGILDLGNANENMGRFLLAENKFTYYGEPDYIIATNSTINFTGTTGILTFAASGSEIWDSGAMLIVSNWNGSLTGGGSHQLKFGTDAAGLTAGQLGQIRFVNPAVLPPGQYPAKILSTGEIVPNTGSTNYWIKGVTGAWQETNSWSLHQLPAASQSMFITGSWLNVHIDPDTKNNFPQTLTVGDVTVGGSATTFMLNYISENIPFHALNGLTVAGESPTNRNSFLVLQSGAYVDSGGLYVTNGQVRQDGGFVHVTNADTWLNNGEYYLTNGVFDVGTLWLGSSPSNQYDSGVGSFFQYGGTVTASNVQDGSAAVSNSYSIYGGELDARSISIGATNPSYFFQYGGRVDAGSVSVAGLSAGSSYTIQNGELVTSGLSISGDYGGCQFTQNGGTVQAGSLTAGATSGQHSGSGYVLNGGTLNSSSAYLSDYGIGFVLQNGGAHSVSGTLSIHGVWDSHSALLGLYRMTAGTLTASNLALSGGEIGLTNNASASFEHVVVSGESGVDVDSANGFIDLFGGTFSCGDFHHTGLGGAQIIQSGGSMVVSNLLEFGGRGGGSDITPLNYSLNGGTLSASNIEITANLIVRSTNNPAVINPGYFKLGGLLDVSVANVQFGRFTLESNAVIKFTGSVTRLGFADSHAQSWADGMFLAVSNWNGSLAGGGAHQLKFGTNGSGLTTSQISRIQFVNPAGFPAGTYAARILSTGEVVPYAPGISAAVSNNALRISWTDGSYTLQSATNVWGPWTNVLGATSPYTGNFAAPQGFFRLVR